MSNSDNIIQTIKTTIQDVVAPDVRELKVRLDSVDKRLDGLDKRFDGLEKRFELLQEQMTTFQRFLQEENAAHFRALLAAINQNKAETELMVYKQVSGWQIALR